MVGFWMCADVWPTGFPDGPDVKEGWPASPEGGTAVNGDRGTQTFSHCV